MPDRTVRPPRGLILPTRTSRVVSVSRGAAGLGSAAAAEVCAMITFEVRFEVNKREWDICLWRELIINGGEGNPPSVHVIDTIAGRMID